MYHGMYSSWALSRGMSDEDTCTNDSKEKQLHIKVITDLGDEDSLILRISWVAWSAVHAALDTDAEALLRRSVDLHLDHASRRRVVVHAHADDVTAVHQCGDRKAVRLVGEDVVVHGQNAVTHTQLAAPVGSSIWDNLRMHTNTNSKV